MFTARFARRTANRYRKRGLDKTAQRMVELVEQDGLEGVTVLEVGGGIGDIQVEMLKRGAARTTNLELSPAYEAEAQRLLADTGLTGRADRRIVDLAASPAEVEPVDVVILHRVVCCYPDYVKLLGAVADHARRQVVFSHPPRNAVARVIIGTQNLFFRLSGSEFRVFAHSSAAMLRVLSDHGLYTTTVRSARVWQIAAASRGSRR
jgi:2-polyprenyl-3-methyl-5-hydroxy-6-metoxy-1,4-benzoquinol methylase